MGCNRTDENYAREAMELFAGPRQLQTKTDVRNGAKALVGWEVSGDVLESQ